MARVVLEGSSPERERKLMFLTKNSHVWSLLWIAGLISTYFCLSIGLTFYQRWFIMQFKYPLMVALCHMSLKFVVCWFIRCILACWAHRRNSVLEWRDVLRSIVPVGLTSGIDIAFSNWAFEFITISLYTMTKSTSVVFILMFGVLLKLERKSWSMFGIVAMIAGGLAMFTYKSTQFHLVGFLLVLFASFSSGLRWTLCQFVMQRSDLGLEHPLDMMYHLQPWMFLVILPFFFVFEGEKVVEGASNMWGDWLPVLHQAFLISIGGSLAIALELAEYRVVSSLSSLTLSIAAIFKEVITLALAVVWSGDEMSRTNAIGLLFCLGGIVLHVAAKATAQRDAAIVPHKRDDATARFLHHDISSSDEQDNDDDSSSEVLFSVLNSRDR